MNALAQTSELEAKGIISAQTAYEKAKTGEIILIDIRQPMEWQQTGVGENATPLTMHQSGQTFFKQLEAITQNDKSKPIALICAVGGRSGFLQPHLKKAGYTNVYNVAEGMLGSKYGAGWLKAHLPTKKLDK